jgi:Prolyl oligopeptidase family
VSISNKKWLPSSSTRDFIATGNALASSGVTTSKQLAIRGDKNCGLLTGAMRVERSRLFGAVLFEVSLFDKVRFHFPARSFIDRSPQRLRQRPQPALPDDLFAVSVDAVQFVGD